jgi:hypothetical protein
MNAVVFWMAILVGASLPILGLAAFAQWRWARLGQIEENRKLRRSVERSRPRASSRNTLEWVSATIGRQAPDRRSQPTSLSERRCPHCRAEVEEASFFCRRCGSRLFGS